MSKSHIEYLPTRGYWSCLGGVEVKKIVHDDEDIYVYCISGAWTGHRIYHRVRVLFSTSRRAYIRIKGTRLYLDEYIREGI